MPIDRWHDISHIKDDVRTLVDGDPLCRLMTATRFECRYCGWPRHRSVMHPEPSDYSAPGGHGRAPGFAAYLTGGRSAIPKGCQW